LVRQTTEGTQIRLVFNEGKNYVSHPIAAGWHIIQFSVLQNAMAQRLANEMQTTAK
jgi:hypothetical protein